MVPVRAFLQPVLYSGGEKVWSLLRNSPGIVADFAMQPVESRGLRSSLTPGSNPQRVGTPVTGPIKVKEGHPGGVPEKPRTHAPPGLTPSSVEGSTR